MVDWFTNEAPRWIVLSLWIIVNVSLFITTYLRYFEAKEYFYLRQLTGGRSLACARASAMCLKFNTMLILLPVCRKLISIIRGSCACCPQPLRRQLDKAITYHQYLAYMICLHSAIHIGAHYFNFENLAEAQRAKGDDLRNYLSRLPFSANGSWINPIRTTNPEPIRELFKTVSGISGVIITLCLVLIVSSSTEIIRRSYFELFWFTHHIFIVYLLGFVVHGAGMLVRHQTNVEEHQPATCKDNPTAWGSSPCAVPQFEGSIPDAWIWLLIPVLIYIMERTLRHISGRQRVVITQVVTHPSRVFELRMQKKGFSASPGQYIIIKCPSISRLEWHPFTLTSAPSDDYFSVHIRRVGDWTEQLAKLCHVDEGEFQEAWKMPSLHVDGPFGTATEDVLAYDVCVLVGCGIGVTPFASVLKSFWHRFCEAQAVALQHIHLFWVCPDTSSFEWFQGLLLDLERQMRQVSNSHLLSVSIFVTRGWNANQARNIVLHDDSSVYDAVTGLHHKTQYGRPNWESEFKHLSERHKGSKTGVFFCGPKQLSTTLHKLCNKFSHLEDNTKFVYNKEHF